VVALGAAADPGTLRADTARWVVPHFVAGALSLVFFAAAFWTQWQCMAENGALIEEVLHEVHTVRERLGLPLAS
jgi:hypothetical protein